LPFRGSRREPAVAQLSTLAASRTMKSKRKMLKMSLVVVSVALAVLAFAVVATTRVDRKMGMTLSEKMTFYENDTFKFMVEVISNDCVDFTCQGFWAGRWSKNPKCAAGINFPARGYQIEFTVLRWSWRG
jgi:hypothetical protein